jgi:HTH-type transcriptional regulator/antitoxin HigA
MNVKDCRTPGQLIDALLTERGWTKRVLAIVLGVDEAVVTRMVNDKRAIDAPMAIQLSEVFDVPAQEFLALQTSLDLALARFKVAPDPGRATRAALFGDLPVGEMIKRGWLDASMSEPRSVEVALTKFFGVSEVDEIEVLPHAARKTHFSSPATPAQLAWLYRVRRMALDLPAPKYSHVALSSAITKLKALLISPDAARKAPRIVMECGIRYVIVESLSSAKIDGVCFWINDQSPVIGMSLRYDRIDNFWFVLRHELEHVLRGHGKSAVMLDAELEREKAGRSNQLPIEERQANEAAANFCVPRLKLDSFIARKSPMFSERDIRGFAATLQIHPGLVAGQLQHELDRYDLFRNHLAKIRSIVTPNAYVDGWGDIAPVEQ